MIVVDASSLAKYILKEENWVSVENYLYSDKVLSIDLVLKEVLNAIWKHYILLKSFDYDIAMSKKNILYILVKEDVIAIEPEDKYLDKGFSISIENGIPVYDALYIAQALEYGAKLLTSDERQSKIARRYNIDRIYIP